MTGGELVAGVVVACVFGLAFVFRHANRQFEDCGRIISIDTPRRAFQPFDVRDQFVDDEFTRIAAELDPQPEPYNWQEEGL